MFVLASLLLRPDWIAPEPPTAPPVHGLLASTAADHRLWAAIGQHDLNSERNALPTRIIEWTNTRASALSIGPFLLFATNGLKN